MGQKKYPPLTPNEIVAILKARGFRWDRNSGDHQFFSRYLNGKEHLPQVDMGVPQVSDYWLKLTITESGLSREDFYCSTKATAKKIGMKCVSDEELASWALSVNIKGETGD